MKGKPAKSLVDFRIKAQGLVETDEDDSPPSAPLKKYYARYEPLRGIPGPIIRQAWFNVAHLLLPPKSKVADLGCGDGKLTYAMAAMNSHLHFTGIDADETAIQRAKEAYQLPNLEYKVGDITQGGGLEPESMDAVINSFILHEILSESRYSERRAAQTLEGQLNLLKQDGILYIRDHALHHPPNDFVLMEMPDEESKGESVEQLSEADLLIWYAEKAQPREDPGCHGFFLEELPPRFPQTRLFRLPYKWAYEFVLRKDDRPALEERLDKEFAFFTEREFIRTLKALGARALYTAPYWNETVVRKRFENRFRLYNESGDLLGPPPTSFIVVAQKAGERKSLALQERRPSSKAQGKVRIVPMRNDRTGRIVDVITRDADNAEIIPYRITPEGQLNIFVHAGVPRSIINAVPRHGRDLDGKRWSGHMIEAISVPASALPGPDEDQAKGALDFTRNYLGLKPALHATFEQGPSYYPAPDTIDELIQTKFLLVSKRRQFDPTEPKLVSEDIEGFTTKGLIREINAQRILDAIAVGYIPNVRLEMQILALYDKLGYKAETWENCPLLLEDSVPEALLDTEKFMRLKAQPDHRFKKAKGPAGQYRTVQSIFVDEGWVEGGIMGLAQRDMEFIITEENTLNKAVILPMTQQAGEIMIGVETEYLPVLQRHEGNGVSVRAPSIMLPRNITTVYEAKKFVADSFKVPIDNVWKLGEAYFCHAGITPMRIFPFAVATKGAKSNPLTGPVEFAPMKYIWRIFHNFLWKGDALTMTTITRVRRRMGQENDMGFQINLGKELARHVTPGAVTELSSIDGLFTSSAKAKQDVQAKNEAKNEDSSRKLGMI